MTQEANKRLELRFDGEDWQQAAIGFVGAVPVATWLVVSASPFLDAKAHGVWPVVAVAACLVTILVLPWLVPCLVLRARQPRGAHLTWNDAGVELWDGPWQSVVLPWTGLGAAHAEWSWTYRGRRRSHAAVQLRDRKGGAAITVWTGLPGDVPAMRRRQCVADLGPLLAELDRRGIACTGTIDWSLASDPARPPRARLKAIARFGYPLAVLAPLVLPLEPAAGLVLAAGAAVLLAVRAWPALAELGALRARRSGVSGPEADCLRWRLRAVWAELLVRVACVAMVVWSTIAAWIWLR